MVQNRTPGNDIAWQQALDWVMLMRDGMLDASAEQRLLKWLDQSPDHIESFRQACAVWQATGAVTSSVQAALEARMPRTTGQRPSRLG
ncbi:FecR/PupR family sigma factor regulator [Cupriavidus gilardii]|uniref:FecR/PupR family sigma factor regulator n=1 Tax=Cupriavidus gilardii TaxID=82541 RepID=UPI0007E3DDF3|nr:DUF4880 domain-containing protein [Cupriavidus gilardii]